MSSPGFDEFVSEIEQSVLAMIKNSSYVPKDVYEHFQAFSAAIDWSERWIQALLALHTVLFMAFVLTRKNINIQTILFFIIVLLVFLAESINSFCAVNWRLFSKQNYFDEHGVFASTMFAAPLLIIGFCQLINFLLLASSTMITVKRLELQKKKRAEANQKKSQ